MSVQFKLNLVKQFGNMSPYLIQQMIYFNDYNFNGMRCRSWTCFLRTCA